jgi:hypothetical protein
MSISLTVGSGDPISLDNLTDLKSASNSLLKLGSEFAAYLNKPISALPTSAQSTSIQYASGNQSWSPGPLTFTLSGGVTGKISVITSGALFNYTDGFATEVVPAGIAYVCVELDFQIAGGISGSYTSGIRVLEEKSKSPVQIVRSAKTSFCYCVHCEQPSNARSSTAISCELGHFCAWRGSLDCC